MSRGWAIVGLLASPCGVLANPTAVLASPHGKKILAVLRTNLSSLAVLVSPDLTVVVPDCWKLEHSLRLAGAVQVLIGTPLFS
jgi:hypothetical protein